MTTYVEPQGAQLGDVVLDMCGSGKLDGTVAGIDTQAPGILVRWSEAGPVDVYSLDSPVWSCFAIVRYGAPELCATEPAEQTAHDASTWRTTCQGLKLPWSNPDGV